MLTPKRLLPFLLFLAVVVMVGVGITGLLSLANADAEDSEAASPVHCIQFIEPIKPGEVGSELKEQICFDTWTEAAFYVTNGTVQLPDNASEKDYIQAVNAYQEQLQ